MRRDQSYLLDMLLAARDASRFMTGLTFADLERDRMAQLAILKSVEIIGEAAAQVSDEFREAHKDIPWSSIIGMRNRLVHGYFAVKLERVWETVERDVPRLIRQLEPLIPPEAK